MLLNFLNTEFVTSFGFLCCYLSKTDVVTSFVSYLLLDTEFVMLLLIQDKVMDSMNVTKFSKIQYLLLENCIQNIFLNKVSKTYS